MPVPPTDVQDFAERSSMPEDDVIEFWGRRPKLVEKTISGVRADIYGRLRKRYVTPMDPEPEALKRWIARIGTPEVYRARGVLPNDPTIAFMDEDRTRAYDEIKEAADSKDGLFDLPLLDSADGTGISKGGPLGYSEPGPYEWTDHQAEEVRQRGR